MAFQCGAVLTKFFQWCSSVPCKYSLGRPVVSQCTLGQPVAFQWYSSVHWTSQCTLAQGKGYDRILIVHCPGINAATLLLAGKYLRYTKAKHIWSCNHSSVRMFLPLDPLLEYCTELPNFDFPFALTVFCIVYSALASCIHLLETHFKRQQDYKCGILEDILMFCFRIYTYIPLIMLDELIPY